MRKFSSGINTYDNNAHIIVEDARWYIFLLDWVSLKICDWTPNISFPNIPFTLKNKDDIEFNNGDEKTTFKNWYGSLSDWWHIKIHQPILNYCDKRTKMQMISADYDIVLKVFDRKDEDWIIELKKN